MKNYNGLEDHIILSELSEIDEDRYYAIQEILCSAPGWITSRNFYTDQNGTAVIDYDIYDPDGAYDGISDSFASHNYITSPNVFKIKHISGNKYMFINVALDAALEVVDRATLTPPKYGPYYFFNPDKSITKSKLFTIIKNPDTIEDTFQQFLIFDALVPEESTTHQGNEIAGDIWPCDKNKFRININLNTRPSFYYESDFYPLQFCFGTRLADESLENFRMYYIQNINGVMMFVDISATGAPANTPFIIKHITDKYNYDFFLQADYSIGGTPIKDNILEGTAVTQRKDIPAGDIYCFTYSDSKPHFEPTSKDLTKLPAGTIYITKENIEKLAENPADLHDVPTVELKDTGLFDNSISKILLRSSGPIMQVEKNYAEAKTDEVKDGIINNVIWHIAKVHDKKNFGIHLAGKNRKDGEKSNFIKSVLSLKTL